MNLGYLSKDIWGLIFNYFEINFCPNSLNALSLTCKKLNEIDNERKRTYIRQIDVKLKNGRVDLAAYVKYKNIDTKMIGNKNMISFYPDLHKYLDTLKVDKYEDLFKLKQEKVCEKFDILSKDVDLICHHTSIEFIFVIFSLIKHKEDIVNAIMDFHF